MIKDNHSLFHYETIGAFSVTLYFKLHVMHSITLVYNDNDL